MTETAESPGGEKIRNDVGLRLIVGYKLVKAAAEIILGAMLIFFASAHPEKLLAVAVNIRHHAAAAWSVALAEQLVDVATGRKLLVAGLAAVFDGVLSAVEAWALHRRHSWGRWLVVGTTSTLLPFEVRALSHRFSAGRVALLLLNLAIVIYLIRREAGPERAGGSG